MGVWLWVYSAEKCITQGGVYALRNRGRDAGRTLAALDLLNRFWRGEAVTHRGAKVIFSD